MRLPQLYRFKVRGEWSGQEAYHALSYLAASIGEDLQADGRACTGRYTVNSKKTENGFQDQLSLNAGEQYCRMLLSTFIKLHLSLRSLFCLVLSGHFTQVLLYLPIAIGESDLFCRYGEIFTLDVLVSNGIDVLTFFTVSDCTRTDGKP